MTTKASTKTMQRNDAKVTWNVMGGRVLGPAPFLVAGIVNVTPDSFFDGGWYFGSDEAIAHGRRLIAQGANILDVGGESTRPGAAPTPLEEELARVLPVVQALSGEAVVSVDTYKAAVAKASLEAGALIINDISAALFDPEMADVLGEFKPGYVLMHAQGEPQSMQKNPEYGDVVAEIAAFFEERMTALVKAGLPEDRIVLDPGIGFGKTLEHNLDIFRNIEELMRLGRPVYMGLSNKSWIETLLGLPKGERSTATQVATALLASRGVRIHRVHEVESTVQTLSIVSGFEGWAT